MANNPAVCAEFFQPYMDAFIHMLLHYNLVSKDPCIGVVSWVAVYYGCVEAQGRGSSHCHMLIWLVDALNLNKIKDHISDDLSFTESLIAFLEDLIATSVVEYPLPDNDIPSSLFHPSSVCMLTMDSNDKYTCKQL